MSGDTQLQSILLNPGIQKNTTEYLAEGGWVECQWVRFNNGRPEKCGGWTRETVVQAENELQDLFTGVSRAVISWNDLDFNKYFVTASHKKVEMVNGGKIFDITPIRESVSLNNAITTNGTNVIQITDVNHNTVVGDYIYVVSQATAVNGVDLQGQYVVNTVIDLDNYTVLFPTAASGSTSNAGGVLEIDYFLENGAQSNGSLTGWSGGTWGTPGEAGQGWNRPRAGAGGLNLRQWSLDVWGEDMVANVRGGKIYHWDATTGPTERLQEIVEAPDRNLFILTSQPSRHLIAFGSELAVGGEFDPLIIRWASQESLTEWDITDDNTAGEYRLPKGNYIMGACQTRSEIVIFTDTDVYSMRYIGGDTVFQIEPLGTNISVLSQHSFVDINGVIYWQGIDKFYMYDGVVRILPTSIDKYIFDQDGGGKINSDQKEKSFAGVNKEFNEIIFLYPRYDNIEVNAYVKYNYVENTMDYGTLDRTTWLDKSVFPRPYALSAGGRLYVHEQGKDADGAPLLSYIRSSYFDIGDGQDLLFVDRIVPDVRVPENRNIEVTCFFKKYPHPQANVITKGPYYFDDAKDKISLRGRGRAMSIEYRVTSTGSDFEIGKVRIGLQPDGGR